MPLVPIAGNNRRQGDVNKLRECFVEIPRIDVTYKRVVETMDEKVCIIYIEVSVFFLGTGTDE